MSINIGSAGGADRIEPMKPQRGEKRKTPESRSAENTLSNSQDAISGGGSP